MVKRSRFGAIGVRARPEIHQGSERRMETAAKND
jgi:hypothetical protein